LPAFFVDLLRSRRSSFFRCFFSADLLFAKG